MSRPISALLAIALTGGAATIAQAEAPASASFSIGITGHVPVNCRASLDATVVSPTSDATSLGQLREFCNSPNGYQIFVDSSPELANATLLVGDRKVALSANGPTLISASTGPAITSSNVILQDANGASGTLSFRIVAL